MDSPHYESDGPVQTERTALLRQGERENTTPLPKLQVFILIVAQLAEPISATVIFPFINQVCGIIPRCACPTLTAQTAFR